MDSQTSHPPASKSILIIGHRGAAGYLPEHTLEGYNLAIDKGADFIEPDLVMTKDGVLIARHENDISGTTDVAQKFPARKTTKTIDGKAVTGFFTEDFTLKEIKTLKAKERLPGRDHGHDFKYDIPTFEEILALREKRSKEVGRTIGVYPETKHPTYFTAAKLALEPSIAAALAKHHLDQKDSPVFLQSFELGSLIKLRALLPTRLILLLDDAPERPFDFVTSGDPRTYGDLILPASLRELKKIVDGIGPSKRMIVPESADGHLLAPTHLIEDAHAAGLQVHPYTFRSDAPFLNKDYAGDPAQEYLQFFELGVDAVFSDFSGDAFAARKAFISGQRFKPAVGLKTTGSSK